MHRVGGAGLNQGDQVDVRGEPVTGRHGPSRPLCLGPPRRIGHGPGYHARYPIGTRGELAGTEAPSLIVGPR